MSIATDELVHAAYSYSMTTAGLLIFYFCNLSPYFLLPYLLTGLLAWPCGFIQFDFLHPNYGEKKEASKIFSKVNGMDSSGAKVSMSSVLTAEEDDDDEIDEGIPDFNHPEVRRRSMFPDAARRPSMFQAMRSVHNMPSTSKLSLNQKPSAVHKHDDVLLESVETLEEKEKSEDKPQNSETADDKLNRALNALSEDEETSSFGTLESRPFKQSNPRLRGGNNGGRRKSFLL